MTGELVKTVQAVAVGGVANGVVTEVLMNAEYVRLSRPEFIRPLRHSQQSQPDVAKEHDDYQVSIIQLPNNDGRRVALFGIMVQVDMDLPDAFSEIVRGFVLHQKTEMEKPRIEGGH